MPWLPIPAPTPEAPEAPGPPPLPKLNLKSVGASIEEQSANILIGLTAGYAVLVSLCSMISLKKLPWLVPYKVSRLNVIITLALSMYDFASDVIYFIMNSLGDGFAREGLFYASFLGILAPSILFALISGFAADFSLSISGFFDGIIKMVTSKIAPLARRFDFNPQHFDDLVLVIIYVVIKTARFAVMMLIGVFSFMLVGVVGLIWLFAVLAVTFFAINLKLNAFPGFNDFTYWLMDPFKLKSKRAPNPTSVPEESRIQADEAKQTFLFNLSVFVEVFFEAIPQLIIVILDQSYKANPEARLDCFTYRHFIGETSIRPAFYGIEPLAPENRSVDNTDPRPQFPRDSLDYTCRQSELSQVATMSISGSAFIIAKCACASPIPLIALVTKASC
jgi:hypothetical protein